VESRDDPGQHAGVSSPGMTNRSSRAAGGGAPAVAEIQGLYGPFSFPEKLLQKIWLRGDFDRTRAMTVDGRRLAVVQPGRWNLLGGPDFAGARLRLGDGPEFTGDVELHLHAADWAAHGHARDEAYDGVVLHVVLFPPPAGHVTCGGDGREIPVIALLPLLHHDLEEYAADDAVETLANRPVSTILEHLGPLPAAERDALLARHAKERWRQKVHFARLRVQRLGWDEACHQTALEILGYRFNRAPMLRLAAAWPLAAWTGGAITPDHAFAAEHDAWSLQGVRPANHPRTRLRQYAEWTESRPDWPARLAGVGLRLPVIPAGDSVAEARRRHDLGRLRRRFAEDVAGEAIGGTRLDTLVCDGWLPLLTAHTGLDLHGLWFVWFAGDLPPAWTKSLRTVGVFAGRSSPSAHGWAQGLLGWLIERERTKADPAHS
jgi:hypothetical protein